MTSSKVPMEIDGSTLEGGGQILRNAAAFACLMSQPITISNIRAGRAKPGLAAQHLSGLKLLSAISGGELIGAELGSTRVTFVPNRVQGGEFEADTKTAGSVALLLQAALPCLLLTGGVDSRLILKGGTNADMAPQVDFFPFVMAPMIEGFGVKFSIDVVRRGYYPKGGGEIHVSVSPVKSLTPIHVHNRGPVTSASIRAFSAGALPLNVAREIGDGCRDVLVTALGSGVNVSVDAVKETNAVGNACGVTVVAKTSFGCVLGADKLGKRGVPGRDVGREAGEELAKILRSDACVDPHMQDQLIVFMALADGVSSVKVDEVTLHTKTAIWVAEKMTEASFKITPLPDGTNLVECKGIGFVNPNLGDKLGKVYGKDWYTQKVEDPGMEDGRKRLKVDEKAEVKDVPESTMLPDENAEKLKNAFESSAW